MGSASLPPRPVVLVVEDEAVLRFYTVDVVEAAGFEAIEAENSNEASAILESRSDIRIVLTDINLQGSIDGLKLAASIRNRWPPIEIIIVSGAVIPTADRIPQRGVFLSKPYSKKFDLGPEEIFVDSELARFLQVLLIQIAGRSPISRRGQ